MRPHFTGYDEKYDDFCNYLERYYFSERSIFSFTQINNYYDDILNGDFDTTNNGSECLNSCLNRQITGGFSSNATMSQIIHSHKANFLNQKFLKLSLNKLNKRRRDVQDRRLAIQSTVTTFSEMTPEQQNEALIDTMHTCGSI